MSGHSAKKAAELRTQAEERGAEQLVLKAYMAKAAHFALSCPEHNGLK